MSNKVLNAATIALEITKMALTITVNTSWKLLSIGKTEVVKQYLEYQQKATPQQREVLRMLKGITAKYPDLARAKIKKIQEAKNKVQATNDIEKK